MDIPPYQRSVRGLSPWTRSSSILPAINLLPDKTDAIQRPSRRRARRADQRWLPLGNARVMARIIVFEHGGHQRPVIHRGSHHSRFRLASMKTNTTQLGEGKGEEALAHLNEVWTDVVDYECHPFQFEFQYPHGIVRYRPDCIRVFRNGRIEVVEVKRTPADLDDIDYRERLALAAEVCRQCGWEFKVLYLADILGSRARQMNVSGLLTRRSMELSSSEEKVAGRLIARGAAIEWRMLCDRIAPADRLHGDAIIERLLARGLLSTDLDVRFTPCTILMPMRPFTGVSEIRL